MFGFRMASGLWRQLNRGIRTLIRPARADRDAADEVSHYLEEATAAHLARGLSEADARRAARLELGSARAVEEQVRAFGWQHAIETLAADLRYAARRLRGAPGFTAVAVLTLALGIGATTAILSVMNPILFRPLPYPEADRITTIWDHGVDGSRIETTFGTYRELLERGRSFDAIAVMKRWQPTLVGAAEPERLDGQRVSAGYFRVMGVAPSLGRAFEPGDDVPNGARVVILGHRLWQRRFGADPAVIGRPIVLDDAPWTVVGIMPRSFENVLAPSAEIWSPMQYDSSLPAQGREWGHHLRMAARLKPDVETDQASRELEAIARSPVPQFRRAPWAALGHGLILSRLQVDITRGVKPALFILLGAVSLVLVIACVNVTNLLLGRGVQRRGEFALRAAIGAGKGRLVRQLLTESLLLAVMGGAIGVGVAVFGVRALVALGPADLPRAGAIGVDRSVFLFGLAVTTLVGLAFGVLPAMQASHANPHGDLQKGSRRASGGHRRIRSALVIAEVALALVLLVTSGLLLRSLQHLFGIEPGFEASRLLTMQVQTSGRRFDGDGTTWRFFAQALESVRRVPGVETAALTSQLPLSGDSELFGVHFDPPLSNDPGEVRGTFRYAVSPGYIETMGIPLRSGRLLDERDRADSPLVAVISESLARRRLQGLDPIGQRLRIGSGSLYTVVGVVGDVKQMSLATSESDAVYTTASQWRFADSAMSLVVRTRGDRAALAPAVRQAVWSVDKDQPIVRVATMADLVAATAAERRFVLTVFEVFALAALVLAAAGLYGVLAGSVAERTAEIGVRAALGASRRDILALVVRQGMTLTGLGVVIGVAAAIRVTEITGAMLFGISPLDPVTYLGVIALQTTTAIAACGVPAWRAARVDPVVALRAE